MTSSTQVAPVEKVSRERVKPGGKLLCNERKTCPHCGRSGKTKKIDEHIPTCFKRPQ